MRRRPARVVSVCLAGSKITNAKLNQRRADLLLQIVTDIVGHGWGPIDAVVLPGGFFKSQAFIGHLDHKDRCDALMREGFSKAVVSASKRLGKLTPGAQLVIGVDSGPPNYFEAGDHCCVAFSSGRVSGLARKIFPAPEDVSDDYVSVVPAVSDYSSAHRIIKLPNGQRAMLAACYDLFGLSRDAEVVGVRGRNIRWLRSGSQYYGESQSIRGVRRAVLSDWSSLLHAHSPHLALCSIHWFKRPGLDGFWQRHGIASASASLGGGLVVGAAHFNEWLPTIPASTLASAGVPQKHLNSGIKRRAHRLQPKDGFEVSVNNETAALIRLFAFNQIGK